MEKRGVITEDTPQIQVVTDQSGRPDLVDTREIVKLASGMDQEACKASTPCKRCGSK